MHVHYHFPTERDRTTITIFLQVYFRRVHGQRPPANSVPIFVMRMFNFGSYTKEEAIIPIFARKYQLISGAIVLLCPFRACLIALIALSLRLFRAVNNGVQRLASIASTSARASNRVFTISDPLNV